MISLAPSSVYLRCCYQRASHQSNDSVASGNLFMRALAHARNNTRARLQVLCAVGGILSSHQLLVMHESACSLPLS